jgi:hypothetical protein
MQAHQTFVLLIFDMNLFEKKGEEKGCVCVQKKKDHYNKSNQIHSNKIRCKKSVTNRHVFCIVVIIVQWIVSGDRGEW